MSPKNFREIFHPELEISLHLSHFSKEEANKQTDKHTRNSEIFRFSVEISQEFPKQSYVTEVQQI